MSPVILGLGTAVPPCAVPQGRTAAMTSAICGHDEAEAERLAVFYGLAGIARRHVAMLDPGGDVPEAVAASPRGPSTRWRMERYEAQVGPLAVRAARAALADSGVGPGSVTQVVSVSCTGFAAPGFDLSLIRHLELDPGVGRTHVGFMGCHGALNGLRVARALASADPGARVLLCAAELCSLHFSYGPGSDRSAPNALFADGAAALVIGSRGPGGEGKGGHTPWRLRANGSTLIPGTEGAMSWRVGDLGFAMTLGVEVPALIREHLPGWVRGWLAGQGLSTADVGSWAVHPGGPRILDAAQAALGLSRDDLAVSREVLANYGNMSSPTVLFILERLIARDAPRPCVALGFGPGLAVEAALFD